MCTHADAVREAAEDAAAPAAPPIAMAVENRLLDEFAHDGAAKALLLVEMGAFRSAAAERAALAQAAEQLRVAARREAELAEACAPSPPNPTPSHAPAAPQLVYRTADAICGRARTSTRSASLTRSARSPPSLSTARRRPRASRSR